MTTQEREQVVEVLRCAADLLIVPRPRGQSFLPIDQAIELLYGREEHSLGRFHPLFDPACDAVFGLGPCSVEQLLESAQRVEEGSWP